MSKLYTQMKKDRMSAMKAKNKVVKEILTVFLGDLETDEKRGETITDQYIIKKLKKSIQNCDDNFGHTGEEKYVTEKAIFTGYLPVQLSDEELTVAIQDIINLQEAPNIGTVMKELKLKYDGMFDGKVASSTIKGLL